MSAICGTSGIMPLISIDSRLFGVVGNDDQPQFFQFAYDLQCQFTFIHVCNLLLKSKLIISDMYDIYNEKQVYFFVILRKGLN